MYFELFMLWNNLWHKYVCRAFKFSIAALFAVLFTGECGCFLWAYFTWDIPQVSGNSLNLVLVSDPQVQGYKNEASGILGYITRMDADLYLKKAFSLVLASFSPDAVISLGDLLDEGHFAKDDEFLDYKARLDKIFRIPAGIESIYLPGDNDIGGEGLDSITKETVSRFSKHFGPINEVISLKSFQIVKVNCLSFLRRKPFRDEVWIYNETVKFIDGLSSKLDKRKISILIGHVPLRFTSRKNRDHLARLIREVQPRYVFSGHTHEPAKFQHNFASVNFQEFVVPTCSYRMGTNKMGAAVAVLGPDGSIKYSVLRLPRRYLFFWLYLSALSLCVVLTSPWILLFTMRVVKEARNRMFRRKKCRIFPLKEF